MEDQAATLEKATAMDGTTVLLPFPVPNVGTMAMFQDREGHGIGFFKVLKPAA